MTALGALVAVLVITAAAGLTTGDRPSDTATFAGMCPHPHSQIVLRKAWMDGFGVGRDQLVTRDGEERVAERSRDASGA